ncbi:nicotinate-nucleotide adenylyltransferase [Scheffersomyces xylosifermentans]|uniref:nicotinate-nucleotide adenylyltransferase n=1 Tax=Scheffersomyces xylosifermentans TaxID=1304137 RepID=UPI00315CF7CE
MTSLRRFYKPLQEFISSPSDFKLIYSTCKENKFVSSGIKRICVLDSSFNPPHLGHYALIKESLSHNYSHDEKQDERAILLLLSVKNADKINPAPESFENRLEMMYLMAQDLANKFPETKHIGIGLTNHAKFVDKSVSILNYLHINGIDKNQMKLTFLVGFDTLIRIFNPKYYLPDKLSNSLEEFMKSTDLFCLTRNDDKITIDEQSNYLTDIKEGKHEHIPKHWSDNIFLINNYSANVGLISSSSIRADIIASNNNWQDKVIPEVKDFIINENLYSPKKKI